MSGELQATRAKRNPYAEQARTQKAVKLADVLEAGGINPSMICMADDKEWALAAQAAGVNPPSETTRKLVIDLMQARAVARQRVAGPLPDDLERNG